MHKMKVAFFSAKHYDSEEFDEVNEKAGNPLQIDYFTATLDASTVSLANDHRAVCVFVNDMLDADILKTLKSNGVEFIALRCAGTDNVDIPAAKSLGFKIVHVPSYSPHAVAEFTVGLLLTVVRKYHKAFNRTREGNFSLGGLVGFNLIGKTVGIIGTGQIGLLTGKILAMGFGCKVVAYDPYPNVARAAEVGVTYVDLNTLLTESDVISLHCPLTSENRYMINEDNLALTKKGVVLINTSRGALMDTKALITYLKKDHIGALGMDVYEGEKEYFFRDRSRGIIHDDELSRLMSFYNVVITGHQAFLSKEALSAIATASVGDLCSLMKGEPAQREVKARVNSVAK